MSRDVCLVDKPYALLVRSCLISANVKLTGGGILEISLAESVEQDFARTVDIMITAI